MSVKNSLGKGHMLSNKELAQLVQESATSLLHSLMLFVPVKLVTEQEIESVNEDTGYIFKETGAPFYLISIDPLTFPRWNNMETVRRILADACKHILGLTLKTWEYGHGKSPAYLLNGPRITLQKVEDNLSLKIELVVAGATLIQQADNNERYEKLQKETQNVPVVQQPQGLVIGV